MFSKLYKFGVTAKKQRVIKNMYNGNITMNLLNSRFWVKISGFPG